jgi:hypothetical protein
MFIGKARSIIKGGVEERRFTQVSSRLTKDIRLDWKSLLETNTPAYLRKIVNDKPLLSIILFMGKARSLIKCGGDEKCFTRVSSGLTKNITLDWKSLTLQLIDENL